MSGKRCELREAGMRLGMVQSGVGLLMAVLVSGCVGLRQYNVCKSDYIREVCDDASGARADLCILEFDDEGEIWDRGQLTDTLELIARRNAESPGGIVVPVFIHGWKHNADWSREEGALRHIAEEVARSAAALEARPSAPAPRVVGVYIGWRGDVARGWVLRDLTFWNRLLAADRVASLQLKEAMSMIMLATKRRTESKVILYGHSMGGRILFNVMAEPLMDMAVREGSRKGVLPVDLVVMANPAIRAVDVARFVDLLKRYEVRLMVDGADGLPLPAPGPLIASITSDVDVATRRAFPLGQSVVRMFRTYRTVGPPGFPSQGYLAAHTDGHTDVLLSHRAEVVDGRVEIAEVADRYNDTPYWVIRVGRDICRDHSDINNPRLNELVRLLLELRETYTANQSPYLSIGRRSEGLPPAAAPDGR